MSDLDVASSLRAVMRDIAEAARRARRDAEAVRLIAVSKTVPELAIEEAIACGQRRFGENRVQEAKAKWPALRERHPMSSCISSVRFSRTRCATRSSFRRDPQRRPAEDRVGAWPRR